MIKNKIVVIGLGYIGLPLAIEFSRKNIVIGFDTNDKRIETLRQGVDKNKEFLKNQIKKKNLIFSSNKQDIKNSDVYIVTVPTPVKYNNQPDLSHLQNACKTVGESLKKNSIIIFESTVYPGCTEEFCVPILKKYSQMIPNKDFFYGYSPERINVGDKRKTLVKIDKLVSGSNKSTTIKIYQLYKSIVHAKIHKVPNIKTAEAAKVVENTQRDLNIALINELSLIFKKINLNTKEVIKYAATKWNFIKYDPGLVGGHCIGVDPYYLTYTAKKVGLNPQVILAGRKINNSVGQEIGKQVLNIAKKKKIFKKRLKILIAGFTFKENCSDFRNTKVIDIYNFFSKKKNLVSVYDPWCDYAEIQKKHNIKLLKKLKYKSLFDILIIAVPHDQFYKMGIKRFKKNLNNNSVIFDVKELFNNDQRIDGSL
jgi:UDP-N-acetyl-D-glucosamine/UDP-N-acetyl-D-galactosamine dehydrogenase